MKSEIVISVGRIVDAAADRGEEIAGDQADRDPAGGGERKRRPASATEKLPPTAAATATL